MLIALALTLISASPADDALALALYPKLDATGNVAMSPASIRTALAVLGLGANGKSAGDLLKLVGSRVEPVGTTQVLTSPAVTLAPTFVADASAKLHASFGAVPKDSLDAVTIENALHFKGAWKRAFDKKSTSDEPFFASASSKPVPMMHLSSALKAARTHDVDVVQLEYTDGSTFTLIVPRKKDGLADVERALAKGAAPVPKVKLTVQDVELALPRFHAAYTHEIGAALGAIGLKHAFCGDAGFDFSKLGASKDGPLCVAKIDHSASVDVDEAGTVAEAVTSIHLVAAEGEPERPPPLEVRADRPFLFEIRDASGALTFLGRVADPTL